MSSEHTENPMTSLSPWARALGLPSEGCVRLVVDVRHGALPVVMAEVLPGSEAAAALMSLLGKVDTPAVIRPMGEAERESIEVILADLWDDAQSLAMSGDKGRAEYAEHYAGRLSRVLEAR